MTEVLDFSRVVEACHRVEVDITRLDPDLFGHHSLVEVSRIATRSTT